MGGFYAQLPYDVQQFEHLKLPSIKLGCFSIPKLWIDTNELISSMENMLGLISRAQEQADFDKALETIQDAYDHLDWDLFENLIKKPEELKDLKEQFTLTSKELRVKEEKTKGRVFDQEYNTKIFLRSVYFRLYLVLFLPFVLVIFAILPFIVYSEWIDKPNTRYRKFHWVILVILIIIFFPILLVSGICVLFEIKFVGFMDMWTSKGL